MIRISSELFHPGDELSAFEADMDGAGGVVSFSGYVRPNTKESNVIALELQAYSPLTENGIQAALDRAMKRWPLTGLRVRHRIGRILSGEAIVFVAAASKRRRAAFEAADFVMDYLKTEAVFWKKEITSDGANWIEPRREDYEDQKRWT
ncbi:molybdenum cofactor biosynthesis protein MoaE [Ponticaulis profundi]|uniref:molybdenum cofactor biosynthesis protein MoaE n=1 Tax=Ponticaulis profundi TaxID=2665222 RepID=UPI00366EF63F